MAVPISTREPKQNVNQSVATSSKKTVTTDSTVKKSINITRKLYEQVTRRDQWSIPTTLSGSRVTDLYSMFLQDSTTPSNMVMATATSSQALRQITVQVLTPVHNDRQRYMNKGQFKSRSTNKEIVSQVARQ
ncbi:hypothetical protein Tco_0000965 [Tanacetum coccineum]